MLKYYCEKGKTWQKLVIKNGEFSLGDPCDPPPEFASQPNVEEAKRLLSECWERYANQTTNGPGLEALRAIHAALAALNGTEESKHWSATVHELADEDVTYQVSLDGEKWRAWILYSGKKKALDHSVDSYNSEELAKAACETAYWDSPRRITTLNGTNKNKVDQVIEDLQEFNDKLRKGEHIKATTLVQQPDGSFERTPCEISAPKPTPYETGKAKAKAVAEILRLKKGVEVHSSTHNRTSWYAVIPVTSNREEGTTIPLPNNLFDLPTPTPAEIASGGCSYTVGEDE